MKSKIVTFLLGASALALADYRPNLYTENSYQSDLSLAYSQLRVRAGHQITDGISPFLEVGQELSILSGRFGTQAAVMDGASSFAYGAPGLELTLGKLHLYGQARFRKFYGDAVNAPVVDGRALLVYGDYLSRPIVAGTTELFLEPSQISETLFSTADRANVVATNYLRMGARGTWPLMRLSISSRGTLLEPRSNRPFRFQSRRSKPSLRFGYHTERISVGIIGSWFVNHYFPFGKFEPIRTRASRAALEPWPFWEDPSDVGPFFCTTISPGYSRSSPASGSFTW